MASDSEPRKFFEARGPSRSHISGDLNVFLLQFQYKKHLQIAIKHL